MRIVFMGTPDFSVPSLEKLVASNHKIKAVYTQPARPSGRGQRQNNSPVHICASSYGIDVFTPASLKNEEEIRKLKELQPDAIVVVAYGMILPKEIVDDFLCINIHASILPRWRGAAPIQRSILSGDDKTGVAIMKMDEGLDTGDVYLEKQIQIKDSDNAGIIHDKLSLLGAEAISYVLDNLESLTPKKQQGKATYANKIFKNEAKIDFSKTIKEIDRQIRAFSPYPGAFFQLNNDNFKIYQADYEKLDTGSNSGTIIDSDMSIACADGVIKPLLIQRQGKKVMQIQEFLKGYKVKVGEKFQ